MQVGAANAARLARLEERVCGSLAELRRAVEQRAAPDGKGSGAAPAGDSDGDDDMLPARDVERGVEALVAR